LCLGADYSGSLPLSARSYPELRVEGLHVLRGVRRMTIVHRGQVFAEVMVLDDDGLAARASVHVGTGVITPRPAA